MQIFNKDTLKVKKALVVTPFLSDKGGIQNYNKDFLKALDAIGLHYKVVSRKKAIGAFKNEGEDLLDKVCLTFRFIWQMVMFKPDFLFCNHVNFSLLCFIASVIFGKKYSVICYGVESWNLRSFSKKTVEGADFVITISQTTKKRILDKIPQIERNIVLLPPTFRESIFYPEERAGIPIKKYGINKDAKVILTVARLMTSERYKGYSMVLDIMPEVLTVIPESVYIIVGGGDDCDDIYAKIKRHHLEKSVILAGPVTDDELRDFYNLCDVFVMPSKGEGFGIVFLEALACGKPVISGNRDGSCEALLSGELGILIDPDDKNQIKDAIIAVLIRQAPAKYLDRSYLSKKVAEIYGFKRFEKRLKDILENQMVTGES